jgi:anaerobic selenocysteine-containing dehydrogenase
MAKAFHTCMLCEAVCGVVLDGVGERGANFSVRADLHDPFSKGHICPKAAALPDVVNDPDRVRAPMKRVGHRFVEVDWNEAIDEIGSRLSRIQKDHGRSAVGLYLGNPTVHSYTAILTVLLFARALGTRARFSATSVDQLPHMFAGLYMFGNQYILPVPDIDRTDFFLVFGANPAVSNGSLMTAPDAAGRIKAIRARGGRVVVIDPARTETAQLADTHHFIRPGSDALLLLAMIDTVFRHGLAKATALGTGDAIGIRGVDSLRTLAARFPATRVADAVGIAAAEIESLALAFACARSAVAYGRVGICTQRFGALSAWLVNALNVITGNMDRPGGAMFPTPAADLVPLFRHLGSSGHFGVWKSRVRGLPEFGGELPSSTLAEEIATEGEGQLRGLVTFAGNPVLSTPNGARLDAALRSLDCMVSIDLYRNETTRHAHFILPTAFGPERDHYDLAFYGLAVRNAARFARACVPPPPGVREDWRILADLAASLRRHGGGRREWAPFASLEAIRRVTPKRVLASIIAAGPYGLRKGAKAIGLSDIEASVHGVDLGPLEPRLHEWLRGKHVDVAPQILTSDAERLDRALQDGAFRTESLVLIGRRALRSNNSWMHNSARLVKGPDPCVAWMHPDDAASLGLRKGDLVELTSRVGRVTTRLDVTNRMGRGVVSLPHGWGHDKGGELATAAARPGVSINDLTDETHMDGLSCTAAFSGVPVVVRAAEIADDTERSLEVRMSTT